jgi:hypothetical protein
MALHTVDASKFPKFYACSMAPGINDAEEYECDQSNCGWKNSNDCRQSNALMYVGSSVPFNKLLTKQAQGT